jgi:hypothetical protein
LVGHEHANSASVVWGGIRFQYGQKSSTYDRANYVNLQTGAVTTSYSEAGTPLIGGTVWHLDDDGSILAPYIYLCENAGGGIDWDQWETEPEPPADESLTVSGMQIGTELTLQSGLSVTKVTVDGQNAFAVKATSQGKVYFAVDRVNAATTMTFSVFVPEGSAKLSGMGELAIRIKNASQSYLQYRSDGVDGEALVLGTWQTFTVNLKAYSADYTEFAFIVPAGNTYYFKDITLS